MLATILNLFGWTMLDVTVHLLNVFPLVRAVHHLSIITALIARMSLWSVVSTNEQKGYKYSSLFIEFSLPHSNGPYATVDACNIGDHDIYNNYAIDCKMVFFSICRNNRR